MSTITVIFCVHFYTLRLRSNFSPIFVLVSQANCSVTHIYRYSTVPGTNSLCGQTLVVKSCGCMGQQTEDYISIGQEGVVNHCIVCCAFMNVSPLKSSAINVGVSPISSGILRSSMKFSLSV